MKINKQIPVPIYYQLKKVLKKHISETLKPGDKFFSEHELAKKYDIARVTAGRVIEQLAYEGSLYRIQGKGTFVAEPQKDIKIGQAIGLIMPFHQENVMFAGIIRGSEEIALKERYELIFSNSRNGFGIESEHIARLKKITYGLIIFPNYNLQYYERTKNLILQLKEENFPFVLVDRHFEDINTSYVETDNFWGAYQTTLHLIKLGHKRIGHITRNKWEFMTSLKKRLNGYKQALKENGLPHNYILPLKRDVDSSRELNTFLKENSLTAIFASEWWGPIKVMALAYKNGLKIPEHIAIAGFDEHPENPFFPFTTVIQPMEEIGKKATQILIGRIKGEIRSMQKIKLKPELIVRSSTDRKIGKPIMSQKIHMRG